MRPSELINSDPFDLALDVECWRQADATAETLVRRINGAGGMVFPTVVIRG